MIAGQNERPQESNSRSCQEPYRPYQLPWLTFAMVIFVVVYWFFAVLVQNIDLLGPVTWITYLNGLFVLPILPEPTSPIIRFILNLFNPLVLIHIIGPFLIGKFLADQTTADFLRQFYGFTSRQQASGFFSRLRTAEKQPATTVSQGTQSKSRQLPGSLRTLIMISAIVFFGMLAVFVVIVEITQPPVTSTTQLYYIFLIIFLVLLWLALIGLSLFIVRDYLRRQKPTSGRRSQLAGRGLLVYGLIAIVLLVFPALWMLLIYGLLRSGLASAQLIFVFLLFAFLATTITALVLLFMAPKPLPPLKLTREELEKMRAENAALRVGGPGIIYLGNSHQVAVTESNGRFCRVLGPGMQRLGAYEYVHTILDLRQHEREGRKSFVTRDGLKIEISVAVTFRIASNDAALDEPEPDAFEAVAQNTVTRPTTTALFPYGKQAVQMAAYTKTVMDPEGLKVSDWHQLTLVIAQGQLNRVISELRYDELFAPDQPDQQPHPELVARVQRATQTALRRGQTGIHLLSLRLGPVKALDAEMTAEHISTWRAFWEKQSRMRVAQSEAQAIAEMAEARREAERLIVNTIVEGISEARQQYGDEVTRRIVALRVVETLGRLANRSQQYGAQVGMTLFQQLSDLQETLREEVAEYVPEEDRSPTDYSE